MRVLGLLKMSEQPGEPPAELFEAMDRTIKEISESTTLIDTNGLVPSSVAAAVIHGTGAAGTGASEAGASEAGASEAGASEAGASGAGAYTVQALLLRRAGL